ncbi:exopolygalacturonase-like [Momordica charantia]|uniref:Exopolygalacturonase-like n=1 Tax=Momordica charantia TaxID=3673 RepID=A0A6J1CY21_MOMCH|nr:exopolygalacturonase-like [Momordica charantia]
MAIPERFHAAAAARRLIILGMACLSCMAWCSSAVAPNFFGDFSDGRGRSLLEAAPAAPAGAAPGGGKVIDVKVHGAVPDGKKDSTQAFMKAWVEACHSTGPTKLLFPAGTFLIGPVVFAGPCTASPMTVEIQGTVKGSTDVSQYSGPDWILFESINDLTITGSGTFDGQGQEVWKFNDCSQNPNCVLLAHSIKLNKVKKGLVEHISSVNAKAFHIFLFACNDIRFNNLKIIAPGESPNTDGIHTSESNLINITNTFISTGDDCVSIGQGTTNIHVHNVTCAPGHGLSVGSLGKYKDEKDVMGVTITNCTLRNTTNGLRIKTWADSPPTQASKISFQDIILDAVKNPIIIDQSYGSKDKSKPPSQVKISEVNYKNVRGTTISVVPVSLQCSPKVPCEGIKLEEIDLSFVGSDKKMTAFANACVNAKITTVGKQIPPACAV